ncbi:MAG: SemiSWEET transporter [Nitrospinae bacterium]|nr:SemiSWEET transporter [Nitrospinota bacterium]
MNKDLTSGLGFLAGTLTTLAFLPQVIKSWRTKSAEDISLGMFLLLVTGVSVWVFYGILINSTPLVLFNSVTLCEAGIILYVKIRYG